MLTVTQIINVTAKHIAEGTPRAGCRCPIALALNDQLMGCYGIDVGIESVHIGRECSYLPEEASQFVADFDDGKPVEPFAFALDVPVQEDGQP